MVNVDFDQAKNIAESFQNNKLVQSHLTCETEYDTAISFAIKSHLDEFLTEKMYEWTEDGYCAIAYKRQFRHSKMGPIVCRSEVDLSIKEEHLGFRVVLCIK